MRGVAAPSSSYAVVDECRVEGEARLSRKFAHALEKFRCHVRRGATRSGSAGTGGPAPSVRAAQTGVFRKEGEYWTVGYGGNSFRLKDTKGLGYLAHLLRHPGVEFHVLDLVGGIASQREEDETGQSAQGLPRGTEELEKAGIHVTSLGDAGEMLDEQAKTAYRRRLSELREELEEAKELGKVERAEQAEQEIDALTKELSRAVGLGGRNRRAASASERARQSVTKTIKAVVERIAQSDARWAISCRDASRRATSAPISLTPISRLRGNSRPRTQIRLSSQQSSQPQVAIPLQRVPIIGRLRRWCWRFRRSRWRNEPRLWGGKLKVARFARSSIVRVTGHGSVVMLWDGPGVGKTRLAMEMAEYASRVGFRCSVGHCYERDEPFPYLPIVEIIENNIARAASLDDYRRRMGDTLAELAQIAPSLRRVFPDLPNRWNCRLRSSAAIFCRAFQRRWPARLDYVRSYLCLKIFIGPTNRRWRF